MGDVGKAMLAELRRIREALEPTVFLEAVRPPLVTRKFDRLTHPAHTLPVFAYVLKQPQHLFLQQFGRANWDASIMVRPDGQERVNTFAVLHAWAKQNLYICGTWPYIIYTCQNGFLQ